MRWLQRKKPELIWTDRFLKKCDLTVQKVQKKMTFFQFFPIFFKTDYVYRLFECFYDVIWSTDFNSTETSHVLCAILKKNREKLKKGLKKNYM